ncbi:HSCARG dehydrogenase [Polychaeton citri CBS 116435]|uniref:HSCARG dehydrogenase n=1 Tax=Polychaeton citri CBS 116435 TaxID=1314669 RepID=A0A9P4Q6W6_9PEZI|nr:HSCARG dehydrogenase [Polychaeton citri CBS 116435]
MCRVLAIFGATGQQGGSVIDYVLQDPELSQRYKIRAITRDAGSEKVKQLKEKVEVVEGNVLNRDSLERALTGVHTVFVMTTPSFGPDGLEIEYKNGKVIADVAVDKGVEYIIFSTLPSVSEISGGKYTQVIHFDAKARIEHAFHSPGFFMGNFASMPFLAPQKASDGTWVVARHNSPKSRMPMIDAVEDTGKFIGAILAEPDKFEGKTFCAATALYSMEETVAALSKATGKTVVYKQLSLDQFKNGLPFAHDIMGEAFSYPEEFGYFGPDSGKLVAWAAENARGRLTSFEEYLQIHPLQLL